MNPLHTVLAITLLWATATGLGLAVMRRFVEPRAGGIAIPAAVGLCVAAAVLPTLFALGVPRAAALACVYVPAAAGWLLGGADALRAIDRRGAAAMLLTLIVLAAPASTALYSPSTFLDATLNWWPKVLEVASGAPSYFGPTNDDHLIPSYPRGFAWLCSVAVPAGTPTPQVMMSVTWLCTWLTALCMVAVARRQVGDTDAVVVALIFALLPDVAHHAGSGMVDPVIGMTALVASIGLSRRQHADGALLAGIGAAGAVATKVEGSVVMLAVLAYLAFDLLRRPGWRLRALLGMAVLLTVLPGSLARSSPASRVDALTALLGAPDMLLLRIVACLECIGSCLWPTTAFLERAPQLSDVSWSGWLSLVAIAVLIGRGRRSRFVAAPAWLLLPAAMAVYVTTGVSTRWHITSTLPRLMLEVVPTCLLAATIALRSPGRAGSDPMLSE